MDPELEPTGEARRRSPLRAVALALLVGLIAGVVIDRFLLPSGNDVEVVTGELGVVTEELDRITFRESNESYDLTRATGTECLDGVEPNATVNLGVATIETGDSEPPDEAFLNTPEATVVLWVECVFD